MNARFITDRGQVRPLNEDAGGIFYNQSGQLLAIIADGMGGHQAGDVASSMAVSNFKERWMRENDPFTPDEAEQWLTEMLQDVNEKMYARSQDVKECEGMGTTVVIVIMTNEFATVAHIGDSRCYTLNSERFTQVTEDHSLVNELIRSGEITKKEAHNHPRKNVILKSLGTQSTVQADVRTLTIETHERVLLCTDGVTDKIEDDEIEAFLKQTESIEDIAQSMVQLANERGGEDNISLILIDNNEEAEEGEKTC
ncbi:MAG TPA: Stp1/IreP family PP2C-type Ser/Thr phosphatase [Bacillota bacterium]|nr:Stp1/IreP family PP2C-type Ser/Thr phosphatase [Bacillota bacterium]